jgi:hypothetical protein
VVSLHRFRQLAFFLVGQEAQARQDLLLCPPAAVVLVAPALRPERALAELADVVQEPPQGRELRRGDLLRGGHPRTTSMRPNPMLVSLPTPSHSPNPSKEAKAEKSAPS